jgi:hypothetical protein
MRGLDHGAVALLDALGIKRVWRRPDGSVDASALDTLTAMQAVAAGMRRYVADTLVPRVLRPAFAPYGRDPEVHTFAFSDTIAVTATLPEVDISEEERRHVDALLVDVVSQCAAYVLRKAPQTARPLVYRGVVTCGAMVVAPPSYLGPATDEAAKLYEKAEAALVWLAPSALDAVRDRRSYHPRVWETMTVPYAVPLKSDERPVTVETRDTIALSPFVDTSDPAELAAVRAGMERAMAGADPRVERKRENTLRFLDRAEQAARSAR